MGIGGLITDSKSNGGNKVPILGDIPVLGRLFSSKSVNNTSTNLLIFITAKTVTADGGAPEDVFDPRAIAATGMTREELPGFRAPKGTEVFAPKPLGFGQEVSDNGFLPFGPAVNPPVFFCPDGYHQPLTNPWAYLMAITPRFFAKWAATQGNNDRDGFPDRKRTHRTTASRQRWRWC